MQMRYFDEGKRDAFFLTWQQYVPASSLNYDLTTQKLEFSLQVYFAIYPVLPSSSGQSIEQGRCPSHLII